MADKLTREQQMAVDDRGGKLLVSAAAGSGKTKVLVDRLMKYLRDPVSPADLDEFLIITYTKAAASELRGKIAAKLTEKIAEDPDSRLQQQMQRLFLTKISTVHGFCADILRENAYRLGLAADFRVADENECRELRDQVLSDLLDRAYEQAAENEDFRAFVDTQGVGRNDKLVPELILKVYDSAKCHLDPEGWLDECLKAADIASCADASETVWGKYLMEDLMDYLDCQIRVLEQCVREAEQVSGLEKAGDNLYSATLNSGEFDGIGVDITANGGKMSTGQLEMSNVDLSAEFTEMITTQRGFQANSRIITVSDTLLEELTNLKR